MTSTSTFYLIFESERRWRGKACALCQFTDCRPCLCGIATPKQSDQASTSTAARIAVSSFYFGWLESALAGGSSGYAFT